MKIKQQNQIKTFLIEEFGVDNGNTLFAKQEKILDEIIKNTKNKSKNQMDSLQINFQIWIIFLHIMKQREKKY